METCINWTDDGPAFCSTDDPGIRSSWLKEISSYGDEVKILARPESNDGCLYIQVPVKLAKKMAKRLLPKKHEPMSEERRQAAAERLKASLAAKKGGGNDGLL